MLLYNFVFHPLMKNQKTEQKKKSVIYCLVKTMRLKQKWFP